MRETVTQMKGEKRLKIRNKRRDITINAPEIIKMIIKYYYE